METEIGLVGRHKAGEDQLYSKNQGRLHRDVGAGS